MSVLFAPLIVLLVNVCIPVNVATVESIAIVTGVDPLKLVPLNPVPMVNVLVVDAVTVVLPPKLTLLPLIVIALLANCAFVIVPLNAVVGIVVDAVNALVPLPIRYPVNVVAPVPPLATPNVPPKVIVPFVVIGPPDVVSPVVPPDTFTLVTVPVPATVTHCVW